MFVLSLSSAAPPCFVRLEPLPPNSVRRKSLPSLLQVKWDEGESTSIVRLCPCNRLNPGEPVPLDKPLSIALPLWRTLDAPSPKTPSAQALAKPTPKRKAPAGPGHKLKAPRRRAPAEAPRRRAPAESESESEADPDAEAEAERDAARGNRRRAPHPADQAMQTAAQPSLAALMQAFLASSTQQQQLQTQLMLQQMQAQARAPQAAPAVQLLPPAEPGPVASPGPLIRRPVAKPSSAPAEECAAATSLSNTHHTHTPIRKGGTYGIQFSAIGLICAGCDRSSVAGKRANQHKLCVSCLNDVSVINRADVIKVDHAMPCTICYLTSKCKKALSCDACRRSLGLHEDDRDNKKEFLSRLLAPLRGMRPSWSWSQCWEWRTIIPEFADDRRFEKRCDLVLAVQVNDTPVVVVVEAVLSSPLTHASWVAKRRALSDYAQRNPTTRIVFIVANQNVKTTEQCNQAIAVMVVLRMWIAAALLSANRLPEGSDYMTLLTLGIPNSERSRTELRDGWHVDHLDMPQHTTHEWLFNCHWREFDAIKNAWQSGSSLPKFVSHESFGHRGLISLKPQDCLA